MKVSKTFGSRDQLFHYNVQFFLPIYNNLVKKAESRERFHGQKVSKRKKKSSQQNYTSRDSNLNTQKDFQTPQSRRVKSEFLLYK